MKKVFLAIAIVAAFASCDDTKKTETTTNGDSTSVVAPITTEPMTTTPDTSMTAPMTSDSSKMMMSTDSMK